MADVDDEDDYLSMSFAEPTKQSAVKETSLQRTARLKREAAERARSLSKSELEANAEAARQIGLSTKLDASNNKGARLMAKMGFKGGALGAVGNEGREDPIEVMLKDDRGGLGMDSEKKRKIREAGDAREASQKKVKMTESEYRSRNRQEQEDKRAEGQWWGAMKVLEGLVDDEDLNTKQDNLPLYSIDLLYRPLVKDRRTKEQNRRDMKQRFEGITSTASYDDPELDEDDNLALAVDEHEELDEEDQELDDYEALSPVQRLEKIVDGLRTTYNYCFWCKYRYPDAALDGCPGTTEDEHG